MDIKFVMYFVVPFVLATIILVIGVALLWISVYRRRRAGRVEIGEWPLTGGKILAARLAPHESPRQDKDRTQTALDYEPVVEYAYTVKGVEYQGNRLFPGESLYFSQGAAQKMLDQYPLNAYVPVQYDPNDPSKSTLEKQPQGTDYLYVGGLSLTIFGVVALCFTSFMAFIFAI
jgi:hypothetical protein